MNSEERREARRARREAERAAKRARRIEGCTMENVADLDTLYRSSQRAARGVRWKASTQRYLKDVLRNVAKTRRQLLDGEDVRRGFYHFDLYERGKLRHISSVHFYERVAQKSLTQVALVPALGPTLIADNSANLEGRGTSYAIARMKRQLADHYRRHGSEGWILQVDFENYFGSIKHAEAKQMVEAAIDDPRVAALNASFVDAQSGNLNNSEDEDGLGLGSEPNQILAVSLPNRIDHHVTECCGVEAYGRYMDDSYAIDTDKDRLWGTLSEIEWIADELGITINRKKTRITKLTHGFVFLKKKFSYGENGKVVVRPCRDAITRERRKLKKLAAMWRRGEIEMERIEQHYQSWRGGMLRLDAHGVVLRMDALYRELFRPENRSGGGSSLT